MIRRIAVVGAGWSGLACALTLTGNDRAVTLYDAAAQPGGRARAVSLALGDRDFELDNGQHLLIGAYRETVRLMQEARVDLDRALLRLPFEIRYPDGFQLRAARLPAPLHLASALVSARGLGWPARWQALRWVRRWQRREWTLAEDSAASSLFEDSTDELRRRLWRPLCLAALNVELEQASAQVLLNVLRDSLAADALSADLLIPRRDLSQTFAAPALQRARALGIDVRLRTPIRRLASSSGRWLLNSHDDADGVVLALPPPRAAALLDGVGDARLHETVATLRVLRSAPIATVYLRYAEQTRLDRPLYALRDDPARGRYGQWVFDRGQLDASNAGVLSVVISAAASALDVGAPELSEAVARQLSADFGLPAPVATALIAEKRATIVPAPGLKRPAARLPIPGLYLAGDSAHSEYPSTLEGSVRAGLAAAQAIIDDRRVAL